MGTHWGNEGIVKVGSQTIAEVSAFEFTETFEPVPNGALGSEYDTHMAGKGRKKWSGSITCHWDETDTTGQEALGVGASVTLNLYPEGSTSGSTYYTGLASITERGVSVNETDTVKRTFNFVGNGPLTRSTV